MLFNDPVTNALLVATPGQAPVPFTSYLLADPACLTPSAAPLSTPHSSSFLDLDGDCMPDLFLTKANGTYEIYNQVQVNGTQLFCLVQTDAFSGALVSFADMDRDGMPDMVFFDQGSIFTLYNKR